MTGFPWHRPRPAPYPLPTILGAAVRRAYMLEERWDLELASLPPRTPQERRDAIDAEARRLGRETCEDGFQALRRLVAAEWEAASSAPLAPPPDPA